MSQNEENWEEVIQEAQNREVEDLRRVCNTLDYLVKRKSTTNNLKQAIKSVLALQVQIELAFQSAKLDVIYANSKGKNALQLDNSFNTIENNFKKIRNIKTTLELCRACGMFQHEDEFLSALISKEFESEKKQNSLLFDMEKMMKKTLEEYVQKLNKAELALSKREKNG